MLPLLLFLGVAASAAPGATAAETDGNTPGAVQCPQPRETERAPDSYYNRVNPLPRTAENLQRGQALFQRDARPWPCVSCHGPHGDGQGVDAAGLLPPPRDFTCAATMDSITDGQMYWVIENGSGQLHLPARQGAQQLPRPGRSVRATAMRSYGTYLSETDIWQLIQYIRTLPPSSAPKPEATK